MEGHDQKNLFRRFVPNRCSPTFKFVPAPLLLCNLVCVANCVLSVLNKENDDDDDDDGNNK